MSLTVRHVAALALVLALAGCKKPSAAPPAGGAGAPGAKAAPGQQKAPAPGTQKAAPAGSQKSPQPGQQKAQPGQQKGAPTPGIAQPPAGQQKAAPAPATAQQQAGQQKAAPARPGTPAQAPAAPQTAAAPPADTAIPDSERIEYRREVYSYQGGARDPFRSLLTTNEAEISINDLRLVSILYDPRGGRSVAVVRDRNTPRPFRVRRGDTVGRLRVIQIRQYEVVFQVEEFGFERQEVLTLPRVEVPR